MHNPVEHLAASVYDVLHRLMRIEQTYGYKEESKRTELRQPYVEELSIYMFPQSWGSTALGFGGIGGQMITTAYTVVVIGPSNDAAVYFAGRFAYLIEDPNEIFYDCITKQSMPEVSNHSILSKRSNKHKGEMS